MKTLNDLINEELFNYGVLLEDRYTRDEAIQILRQYGVKDAGNLSVEDLKKLYRKLASTYHPDVGGKHQDFIKIFSAIESLKANPAYTQTQPRPQSQPRPEPQPQRPQQSSSNAQSMPRRSYALPYCPVCNSKVNNPQANFCIRCGTKVRVDY